jgi:hypothetical protein
MSDFYSPYDHTTWYDSSRNNNSTKLAQLLNAKLGTVYGVDATPYQQTNSKGDVISFDDKGYRKAQADWMRGNAAFAGWTDEDIAGFQDYLESRSLTNNQKTAAQLWFANSVNQRNANAESKADREDMLAEIEAYKAGFSNEHIAAAVAQERQAWDTKIAETLRSAQQQAAAQGRVMDNATYAMLRGRLEAQAANAIQKTQMDYEAKRQEYIYNAMGMKNDVYKNTSRTVSTNADLASIISALAGK